MIFPLEVNYKKRFEGDIQKFSTAEILEYFKKEYEKSGADMVELMNDCISIKNKGSFIRRRNRWDGISSAKLQIIYKENNNRIAVYRINPSLTMIVAPILISIGFGLLTQLILVGLFAFLWIGGMSWSILLYSHRISFDDFLYDHGIRRTDTLLEKIEHEANEKNGIFR